MNEQMRAVIANRDLSKSTEIKVAHEKIDRLTAILLGAVADLELANDGSTDLQEFAISVMDTCRDIKKCLLHEGESLPMKWRQVE